MEKITKAEIPAYRTEMLGNCVKHQMDAAKCASYDEFMFQCHEQAMNPDAAASTYTLEAENLDPLTVTNLRTCFSKALQRAMWGVTPKRIVLPTGGADEAAGPAPAAKKARHAAKKNGATKVDFAAYCEAFQALSRADGSAICAALNPSSQKAAIDFLYREEKGDGAIRAPEYGIVKGKAQEIGSLWLLEDGTIRPGGAGGWLNAQALDPEEGRYFIAGAFGVEELAAGASLDPDIVDGLRDLYGVCLKDEEGCLESPQGKGVAARWKEIKAARESVRAAKQLFDETKAAVLKLGRRYEVMAAALNDQKGLLVGVAPYEGTMPSNPTTLEEYRQAGRLFAKKIAVVQSLLAQEDAARAQQNKQVELASYRSKNAGMRKRISQAERLYWRFTNAYDEALKCMPMPTTFGEQYCVEKNKYTMGKALESLAYSHPAKSVCDRSEERCDKSYFRFAGSSGDHDSKCSSVCVSSHTEGRNTSEEEAIETARSYCTTECKSW